MRKLLKSELLTYDVAIDEGNDLVKVNQGGNNSTYFISDATNLAALSGLDAGGNDMLYTTRDITTLKWVETVNVSDITVKAAAGLNITGNDFDNRIVGGGGKDTLSGQNCPDFINGARGNDSLSGDGSKDTDYGDYGKDRLSGDRGNDILEGGKDIDTFVFNHSASDVTTDKVLDYEKGVDVLRLVGSAWRIASVGISGEDTIVEAGVHTVILEDTAELNLSKTDFIIIN